MNFERVVIPIAVQEETSVSFGSGFITKIDEQFYLTTVAHHGDRRVHPRDDWNVWNEKIHVIVPTGPNNPEGELLPSYEFELFTLNTFGGRVPRFKYRSDTERPGTVSDVILLPLAADHQLLTEYLCMELPKDEGSPRVGDAVLCLGRRDEFPALSVSEHEITYLPGPIHVMNPTGVDGDSGGPVIDSAGRLVGMNYGSPQDKTLGIMIAPSSLRAVAESNNGMAPNWPKWQEN